MGKVLADDHRVAPSGERDLHMANRSQLLQELLLAWVSWSYTIRLGVPNYDYLMFTFTIEYTNILKYTYVCVSQQDMIAGSHFFLGRLGH